MISTALIGTILGALTNLLPLFFKTWNNKMEIEKEIKLRELDFQLAQQKLSLEAQNLAAQIELADLLAVVREGESLRSHDASLQPDGVVNSVRALVRPVITFILFGFFLAVKVALLVHLLTTEGLDFVTAGQLLLDDNTMGLIAAVFGFWFGSRAADRHTNISRERR